MAFSSLTFLCVFFPILILVYYMLRSNKARNIFLVFVSLLFYAYGEPVYVLLMIFCTFLNYAATIGFMKQEGRKRKVIMLGTCIIDLLLLGVFKYAGMAVESINSVFSLTIPVPQIALPIGISFFTFQAMSYTIDVYRGNAKEEKNFFKVLLYISFFPQLIAGPIIKYADIAAEIDERSASPKDIAEGIKRFAFGLAKKVLISNALGLCVDSIYALSYENIGAAAAWLGAVSYMLQIYFDFSGYSDMAIGLGRMFGFHFKENFDYPYSAGSMQEFWRRWHISLTNWFREYLYIPLGGNRCGKARTWLNRLIVFFCTGLWHGASWTFVVWGLYHGLFLGLETLFPKFAKKLGFMKYVYVLLVVCVGFVFFRADTMTQAGVFLSAMFTFPAATAEMTAYARELINGGYITALVLGCIFMLPVVPAIKRNGSIKWQNFVSGAGYVLALLFLCLSMLSLASGTYNPFIYYRF